ncbi:hypothetical protein [Nocardioides humi]|uniref:DksA C4-type domain-containing protein n=1 Tax=Nocardioides humi TaxID=449461 RepID=A0ABN2BP81_9ACTN|nr:hypothetical protein [Nocardioides humi]
MQPGESAALTPGQRAQVDQVLSLINEVDKAWTFNEQLANDDEVERVLLEEFMGGEWVGMRSDRAYLLYASMSRMVELDHALTPHDITRQVVATAPRREVECDRCRVLGVPAGVAVVNIRRNLAALVLCQSCVNHLNPDVLIETGEINA